jgi:hypothetical protein
MEGLMEEYYIKLGRRLENINGVNKELWHIVSPELTGRVSPQEWQAFIRYLRKHYTCRLNWGLYANQPVYEYQCNPADLEYSIKYFLKEKMDVGVEVKYERFEYSSDFVPGDVPATHQQHLAL